MSESASNTVGCPQCRKRFVWKPALAGKAVKCTCGKAFKIPDAPDAAKANHGPASAAPGDSALKHDDFELDQPAVPLAPAKNCPSCNLPLKPGAAVCLNCGFNLRTGGKVQTKVVDLDTEVEPEILPDSAPAGRLAPGRSAAVSTVVAEAPEFEAPSDQTPGPTLAKSRSKVADALKNREDDQASSKFLDLYLPIICIVLGVGVMFLTGRILEETPGETAARIGIYIAFMVPMLLVALFATARLWGTSYGPLSTGLLKLVGLALGPMAIADLIVAFVVAATLGLGFILAWVIRIIIVGPALAYMFDLDMDEMFITLTIILFLRFIAGWVIDLIVLGF